MPVMQSSVTVSIVRMKRENGWIKGYRILYRLVVCTNKIWFREGTNQGGGKTNNKIILVITAAWASNYPLPS